MISVPLGLSGSLLVRLNGSSLRLPMAYPTFWIRIFGTLEIGQEPADVLDLCRSVRSGVDSDEKNGECILLLDDVCGHGFVSVLHLEKKPQVVQS